MKNPTQNDSIHSLSNVNPTSHTSKLRVFPSLPDTKENPEFIKKFKFQFSGFNVTECVTHCCSLLLEYKTCYVTYKFDVGKSTTSFRIRLKPNAQLLTQRPSKVPLS